MGKGDLIVGNRPAYETLMGSRVSYTSRTHMRMALGSITFRTDCCVRHPTHPMIPFFDTFEY